MRGVLSFYQIDFTMDRCNNVRAELSTLPSFEFPVTRFFVFTVAVNGDLVLLGCLYGLY
jgi:hypothetical protein